MMSRPEDRIELAHAALLVALESDPALDIEAALAQLDAWGGELAGRIDPDWNSLQRLARLRHFMYEDLRFVGDRKDYYNPANSLLHSVMERKLGIPLTLSILFLELGWRIGVPLEGVGFPGHFLVRLTGEPADLLLDPFSHGQSIHEEDIRAMASNLPGAAAYDPAMIASTGKRDMIARLLLNLKGAYLRQGENALALASVERLLVLHPEDVAETRDRGLLLYRLDRYVPALQCLEHYLSKRSQASDRPEVERHVQALRMILASLN